MLFASLMKDRTMTYEEILSHSMPFVYKMDEKINRLRCIEAGVNPDGNDETKKSVESPLDDTSFYNMINRALK